MPFIRRLFLAVLAAGALGGSALAQAPADHVRASLVASKTAAVPGQDLVIALRQEIDPEWHTYWRNPGDAGQPPTLDWTLPKGWTAGGFVWKAPQRLPVQGLMNYGYEGEVLLPLTLKVPSNAKPGSTVELKAIANFLVCKDICIPQISPVSLTLPVAAEAQPDAEWAGPIEAAIAAAPRPAGLTAIFAQEGGAFRLLVSGEALSGPPAPVYFYPNEGGVIDHAASQPATCGAAQVGLTLKPATPPSTKPLTELAGVLSVGDKSYEITAKSGAVPAFAGQPCPQPALPVAAAGAPAPASGPWAALLGAFIGGLILNLMPCVFPILSMKAAALSVHAHEAGKARAQGLLFLAGVMVTFLALGGVLLAARMGVLSAASATPLGWGFQLQSAPVVAGLGLIMLLAALNLSGVFEIGMSAQGAGAGLAGRGDAIGAFFTGVLAVVVAAPCTAPFMAAALGFALTASPPVAMLVFVSLGLGFALPFVLVAFLPRLLAKMPRPGAWMDVFKKTLAFPMYAASAWLLWVLAQQASSPDLARYLAAAVAAAFGVWLIGLAQKRGGRLLTAFGALVLLAAAALAIIPAYAPPAQASASDAPGNLASEPWSEARVAALVAEGRPVFVDFTAAWCVTCQVNERTALASAKVAKAFEDAGAVYLRADWTNRDGEIAKTLAKHGRAGVPLYLVYGKDGSAPQVLPQLLTQGTVLKALKKASGA